MQGEFDDDAAFDRLTATLDELDRERGTMGNHAFYLSIPPKSFPLVTEQLQRSGLAEQTRRPVAPRRHREAVRHDLKTARELNDVVESVFPPDCVFRIDHYLGKETVQNILALRFANQLYEPIWNAQLRRPRADHDGRGHRRRRPRRLLRRHRRRARRHPEPPAAAARPHRDGGAGLVRRRRPARREGEGARRGPPAERPRRPAPRAASTPAAGRAARRCSASSRRTA